MSLSKLSKYKSLLLKPLVFMAFLLMARSLSAQFYNGSNMTFGKNRVQYREFLWLYYKFDDFDTYFYLNGKELAQFTARYANDMIPLMEDKLESDLDKRVQFIIYNNLTDLKQSNIGLLTEQSYNTGGITHIIGSKVFLYFDGNHVNYQEQIRAGIAQVMFNQMMFGGSLGQQVKTSTFFSIPDWYRVGIISYLSSEWNVDFDNRVRDGILSGRYDKVNNLNGNDAVYAGHSLWRYIAMKYGKAAVSNIVHMTSVSNSIDKGFLYVIGMPFKDVLVQWREYYTEQYAETASRETNPANILPFKYKTDLVYGQPHLSPYGKYLAYTTNELGKYKIYLYDMARKKKKKIMKRGVMIDTKTDYSYPLLAWHPTGKLLAIMIEDKGLPRLYLYNLDEKKFTKQNIYEVQKITDMSYSDDGKKLVMSAVKKGQSDIFVFNIAASSFSRITNDIYSDLNPAFINNSSQIVFSSNRLNDTLGLKRENISEVPEYFDLYVFDFYSRNKVLKKITDTPLANEFNPEEAGFNTIAYLSDVNGIFNSYIAVIDSVVSSVDTTIHYRYISNSRAETNYTRNLKTQQVSKETGKRSFVYFEDNFYKLGIDDLADFSSLSGDALPETKFMADLSAEYKKELAKIKKQEAALKANPGDTIIPQPKTETTMKKFHMVYIDQKGDEFVGMPEGSSKKRRRKDGIPIYTPGGNNGFAGNELTIPKRRNYRVEYFMYDMTTQIDFNYINYNYQPFGGGGGPIYLNAGFNFFFQFGITDLMEDHRMVGGVRLDPFSFRNNEYIFSYSNLKRRVDQEVVFHRRPLDVYYYLDGYNIQFPGRQITHSLFYILKYPFNEALSLRATASYRNEMNVIYAYDQFTLEIPNAYENWLTGKLELVFDNTRSLGMNLLKGTRYKVFAEYSNRVGIISDYKFVQTDSKRNLWVLGFDLRHYTQIHRNFIWANRIAGSTSFGASPLIYYMGGVDNWMFPEFDDITPIDYSQNYAYQTLATNMRGFVQNARNGNNFLVINSELRFPIFQYFSKSPLSSSFLRNFQLVGFGDIGTAWTGSNPYSPENALYTRYVESGPLLVSVEIQKEPIIGGFGFGARIHLMGYFIRGDVAWGVEDYEINQPVFYLSLSLDF